MGIWLLALVGCGGQSTCGVEECADICARSRPAEVPDAPEAAAEVDPVDASAGEPAGLSSFEQAQVGPILEDIRAGVRAYTSESVGLCAGTKDCERYLGLAADGPLDPGTYMLQAELLVPDAGEKGTWKVELNVDCTTTRTTANGSNTSTNNYNKSYTVFYAGKTRGYRLAPLYKIDSPSEHGEKSCTYTLTAPHPEGEATVWEGSWTVPAK